METYEKPKINTQLNVMANTTDLKRVDTALYVEPDELQAGVHALGHDDRDHVVDPEQGNQHQRRPRQLPGTHTERLGCSS